MYSSRDDYVKNVMDKLKDYASITTCKHFYDVNFHAVTSRMTGILEDMRLNPDRRFINDLMSKYSVGSTSGLDFYYTIGHYYYNNKGETRPSVRNLIEVFIKFYIILRGYEKNKNNYDAYSCLLNDVTSVKFRDSYSVFFPHILSKNFLHVIPIIDEIVDNEYYSNMPNTRNLLKEIIKRFVECDEYLDGFYRHYFDKLEILKDSRKLDGSLSKASDIFDKIVVEGMNCSVGNKCYFYSPILFEGNRFNYVNENLLELESNYFIRKDIFNYLKDLNGDFFNDLNHDRCEDSFITYMGIVFDSDTYFELVSKLSRLKMASDLYSNGCRNEALNVINSLDSVNTKKNYCDEVVSYPVNFINPILKPKALFRREKELYGRIDDSISYEFMEESHYQAKSLEEMMDNIDANINRGNKFIRKLKRDWKKKKLK